MHLKGDQPGATNLTLFAGSSIIINSVSRLASVTLSSPSDILKLREAAI